MAMYSALRGELESLVYLCDELNYALPTRIFYDLEQHNNSGCLQHGSDPMPPAVRDCFGYVLVERCSG